MEQPLSPVSKQPKREPVAGRDGQSKRRIQQARERMEKRTQLRKSSAKSKEQSASTKVNASTKVKSSTTKPQATTAATSPRKKVPSKHEQEMDDALARDFDVPESKTELEKKMKKVSRTTSTKKKTPTTPKKSAKMTLRKPDTAADSHEKQIDEALAHDFDVLSVVTSKTEEENKAACANKKKPTTPKKIPVKMTLRKPDAESPRHHQPSPSNGSMKKNLEQQSKSEYYQRGGVLGDAVKPNVKEVESTVHVPVPLVKQRSRKSSSAKKQQPKELPGILNEKEAEFNDDESVSLSHVRAGMDQGSSGGNKKKTKKKVSNDSNKEHPMIVPTPSMVNRMANARMEAAKELADRVPSPFLDTMATKSFGSITTVPTNGSTHPTCEIIWPSNTPKPSKTIRQKPSKSSSQQNSSEQQSSSFLAPILLAGKQQKQTRTFSNGGSKGKSHPKPTSSGRQSPASHSRKTADVSKRSSTDRSKKTKSSAEHSKKSSVHSKKTPDLSRRSTDHSKNTPDRNQNKKASGPNKKAQQKQNRPPTPTSKTRKERKEKLHHDVPDHDDAEHDVPEYEEVVTPSNREVSIREIQIPVSIIKSSQADDDDDDNDSLGPKHSAEEDIRELAMNCSAVSSVEMSDFHKPDPPEFRVIEDSSKTDSEKDRFCGVSMESTASSWSSSEDTFDDSTISSKSGTSLSTLDVMKVIAKAAFDVGATPRMSNTQALEHRAPKRSESTSTKHSTPKAANLHDGKRTPKPKKGDLPSGHFFSPKSGKKKRGKKSKRGSRSIGSSASSESAPCDDGSTVCGSLAETVGVIVKDFDGKDTQKKVDAFVADKDKTGAQLLFGMCDEQNFQAVWDCSQGLEVSLTKSDSNDTQETDDTAAYLQPFLGTCTYENSVVHSNAKSKSKRATKSKRVSPGELRNVDSAEYENTAWTLVEKALERVEKDSQVQSGSAESVISSLVSRLANPTFLAADEETATPADPSISAIGSTTFDATDEMTVESMQSSLWFSQKDRGWTAQQDLDNFNETVDYVGNALVTITSLGLYTIHRAGQSQSVQEASPTRKQPAPRESAEKTNGRTEHDDHEDVSVSSEHSDRRLTSASETEEITETDADVSSAIDKTDENGGSIEAASLTRDLLELFTCSSESNSLTPGSMSFSLPTANEVTNIQPVPTGTLKRTMSADSSFASNGQKHRSSYIEKLKQRAQSLSPRRRNLRLMAAASDSETLSIGNSTAMGLDELDEVVKSSQTCSKSSITFESLSDIQQKDSRFVIEMLHGHDTKSTMTDSLFGGVSENSSKKESSPGDFVTNDDAFGLVAFKLLTLLPFMKKQILSFQRDPEGDKVAAVLPTHLQGKFIEAVRFRYRSIASTPKTLTQNLVMDCFDSGFGDEGPSNPILAYAQAYEHQVSMEASGLDNLITGFNIHDQNGQATTTQQNTTPNSNQNPTTMILDEIILGMGEDESKLSLDPSSIGTHSITNPYQTDESASTAHLRESDSRSTTFTTAKSVRTKQSIKSCVTFNTDLEPKQQPKVATPSKSILKTAKSHVTEATAACTLDRTFTSCDASASFDAEPMGARKGRDDLSYDLGSEIYGDEPSLQSLGPIVREVEEMVGTVMQKMNDDDLAHAARTPKISNGDDLNKQGSMLIPELVGDSCSASDMNSQSFSVDDSTLYNILAGAGRKVTQLHQHPASKTTKIVNNPLGSRMVRRQYTAHGASVNPID